MRPKSDIKQRFWSKVIKTPTCWEWNGSLTRGGYGQFRVDNTIVAAHRFSLSLTQDITNKVVLHTCDNPRCVRPEHLIPGTQQDNISDMVSKGRKRTKLTPTMVKDIKTKSLTVNGYATKYNVHPTTIADIYHNRSWHWV